MAELSGKSVVIKVSGDAVSMTGEATSTTDNKNYQIVNAAKQVIDWDQPVTVLVAGVATVEQYTINYIAGKITFAEDDAGRGAVTVTGFYRPMSTAAYANSYSRSKNATLLETPKFGSTYNERIVGLLSASGTIAEIDVTDELYLTALTSGNPVVIEDKATPDGKPNRVLALLENIEDVAEVTGLQNRTIGWSSKNEYVTLGG